MSNGSDLVMVDLETYDNVCTAAIASIGAVKFNLETRTLSDRFYVTVSPASCKAAGLTFSEDTINWWKQQSPEAQKALRINNIELTDALTQFNQFYAGSDGLCCWGMFDVPILDVALRKCGIVAAWKYWDTLDCRSIAKLYDAKPNRDQGVYHNALDDAINQARFMIDLLNPKEKE